MRRWIWVVLILLVGMASCVEPDKSGQPPKRAPGS